MGGQLASSREAVYCALAQVGIAYATVGLYGSLYKNGEKFLNIYSIDWFDCHPM